MITRLLTSRPSSMVYFGKPFCDRRLECLPFQGNVYSGRMLYQQRLRGCQVSFRAAHTTRTRQRTYSVIRFLEVFSDTGGMFYSRLIWYHSRTHEGQLFPRLPLGRVEVWNYPLDRRKDGMACKEFILNYRELYVTVDLIAAKYFYSIFAGTNYRTEEFCQFPVQYKS